MIQRSSRIGRLDLIARGLPICALVISMTWGFAAWQGSVPDDMLFAGQRAADGAQSINAVRAMVRKPPSPGVLGKHARDAHLDQKDARLRGAVGWALVICVVAALAHLLLSVLVLSRTYLTGRVERDPTRVRELFASLYASIDTVRPFGHARHLKVSPVADNGRGERHTALELIGAGLGGPLRKRLIVLLIGAGIWVVWPFDGFGMITAELSMFLGYPLIIWMTAFGVSEIAVLLIARLFTRTAGSG